MIKLGDSIKGSARSAETRAIVYRADGTIKEDLGVIAYWHRNPLKRLAWNIKQFFKRRLK